MTKVAVLGAGAMGAAIARVCLAAGHTTIVWNRTPDRIAPLRDLGAVAAESPSAAIAAAEVSIVCVLDGEAARGVLLSAEDAIRGSAIVNVTSGTPQTAEQLAQWTSSRGGTYLGGAIMGDPDRVGEGTVRFGFSGSRAVFDEHLAILDGLGPTSFLGEEPGAASADFLAQVAFGYELLFGFLHSLRSVEAEGRDLQQFADRVAGSLEGYAALLPSIAASVARGEYPPDIGPLTVQLPLMPDLIAHRTATGGETGRLEQIAALMHSRIATGRGGEGFASVVELLGPAQS